jgi:hypothetical protein
MRWTGRGIGGLPTRQGKAKEEDCRADLSSGYFGARRIYSSHSIAARQQWSRYRSTLVVPLVGAANGGGSRNYVEREEGGCYSHCERCPGGLERAESPKSGGG